MPNLKKSINQMDKTLGEMRTLLSQAKEEYALAKKFGELSSSEAQNYQIMIQKMEREIAEMSADTEKCHDEYKQMQPGIELLRLSKRHLVAVIIYLGISTGCSIWLSGAKDQNPKHQTALIATSIFSALFGLHHGIKWADYRTQAQRFFDESDNQR